MDDNNGMLRCVPAKRERRRIYGRWRSTRRCNFDDIGTRVAKEKTAIKSIIPYDNLS